MVRDTPSHSKLGVSSMTNELIFVLEIVFTFGCVVAAKKFFGRVGLIAWIAVAMVLANLTVVKTVDLFGINTTLGNIMFASTFLAGDMLNENYGKRTAQRGIIIGVSAVVVFMVCTQVGLLYQPAQIDIAHESMTTLFALNLRTSISSVVVLLLANLLNVWLYAKLRELMQGKYLWIRNNVTTIVSNCLENFLFVFFAFAGIFSLTEMLTLVFSTCLIEIILALCDTPFMYLSRMPIAAGPQLDKELPS